MDSMSQGTLSHTIEGVTHRAQWFVDNYAVVLHVRSFEPLGGMLFGLLIGGTAECVAIRLFHEYLARGAPKQPNS
jgi:hypothetical protein